MQKNKGKLELESAKKEEKETSLEIIYKGEGSSRWGAGL